LLPTPKKGTITTLRRIHW